MNNTKAIIRIINRLDYILTKKQKKGALIVFLCIVVSSLFELLGVSVIYPLLQLMLDEEAFSKKQYISWIYSLFPNVSFSTLLLFFCLLIIIVYLLKNAAMLLCIYIQNRYAARFQRELSTSMLESIMARPYEYFVNTNSALIREHIHGDVAAVYAILLNIFTFISSSLTVALIGVFLIYTDWSVAIASLLLSLICFFGIVVVFKKRLKRAGKEMVIATSEQTKNTFQAIYGIKEISVTDRRSFFVECFDEKSKIVERITVLYYFIAACPDRILEAVCIGGFIGIACIRISLGGDPLAFIPTLGTFAMGAFKILPSISKMSSQINGVVYNQARLENCYNNLKEANRIELDKNENSLESELVYNNGFKKEIIVENVSFKYRNSSDYVINDLSMKIHKGEAIAFIGTSGAGKTTLADMILGLLKPSEGKIMMDGIDISRISHTWAKTIGYVPQSVFLIDDSVRSNIAFGVSPGDIDDDKIWRALEKAQLADYIRKLPHQLDEIVGEQGVKLSGGQRQRIAIARAMYDNPEIIVFDEATSALDTETETSIMEAIDALRGEKTIIIIAHRLTTIRNCDRIIEISEGKANERNKSEVL